jgi:mRNA interferase YafQ
MRNVEQTKAFRRDIKRHMRGADAPIIEANLTKVLELLAGDKPLAAKFRDHAMIGDWGDCRNCHVRPDVVLLYRKIGIDTLQLVRLGSHSDLSI